jgi:hypothetical protein
MSDRRYRKYPDIYLDDALKAIEAGLTPCTFDEVIKNYKKLGVTRNAKYEWIHGITDMPMLARLALANILHNEKTKNDWSGRSLLK